MQKYTPSIAAAALVLAAVFTTSSLKAQQTGYPSVIIDNVRYVPENTTVNTTVVGTPAATYGTNYGTSMAPARKNKRNGHFGFGTGVYILKPEYGDSESHYGVTVGGGFTILPSSVGQMYLNFELGTYYWSKEYTYERYYSIKTWDVAMPLLATAGYEFNVGSPRFRARAGAILGVTTFVRDNSDTTAAAGVFTYGGELGVNYTPRGSFYLDLSYRFLGNSEASFDFDTYTYDMKSTAQQVNFSIGWRF